MGASDDKSTEIRAEEKSRGGMSYEVILSQAITERPTSPPSSASPTSPRQVTQDDINAKLQLAENRRKTLEAERVASVGERLGRLEEAARKRHDCNDEFVKATAAALEQKLDAVTTNREAHLDGLRAKVAEHLSSVQVVRKSVEEQTEKLRGEIFSKMSNAQENRDDHLRAIMAKLQAHEASIQRVRESHDVAMKELSERIAAKQHIADENRKAEILKKLDALRQHLSKVEDVKENLNKLSCEQTTKLRSEISEYEAKMIILQEKRRQPTVISSEQKRDKVQHARDNELETKLKEVEQKMRTKLELADKNRAELAEKAKKAREEQERRAETVRANKERLVKSGLNSPDDLSNSNSSG